MERSAWVRTPQVSFQMLETTIVLAAALKFGLFGATSAGHLVSSFSSAARHGTLSDPMLVIDLTTNPLVMDQKRVGL